MKKTNDANKKSNEIMRIDYDQGDIVYNKLSCQFGIVLSDTGDETIEIIEVSAVCYINNVPRKELQYHGTIDLRDKLKMLIRENAII